MRGKRGQMLLGLIAVLFLLLITLAVTVEPIKETLNNIRGGTSLNCPGVSDFNQTTFNSQNAFEKLVYRPTCFATGLTLVYFFGSVFIGSIVWVFYKWRKK